MNKYHTTVLLQEAVDYLQVQPGKQYIDATLGGGGHTFEILKRGGTILGIDTDDEAIKHVINEFKVKSSELKISKERLQIVKGNFRKIDTIAHLHQITAVAGILFDFGVSGHQFDTKERGFSFQYQNVLDMRMDKSLAVTAADLVNGLSKEELYQLFINYGEEPFARHIANAIVEIRKEAPIVTTTDLEAVVRHAIPMKLGRGHPATRVFQALRIAVNDELGSIEEALPKAVQLLEKGGRIVVISFHSLEDRIVKNCFNEFARKGLGKIITDKPILPSAEERDINTRSRSAKLRVFEKRLI